MGRAPLSFLVALLTLPVRVLAQGDVTADRTAIAESPVPVDVEWTRGLTPALPYPTRTALVRLRG